MTRIISTLRSLFTPKPPRVLFAISSHPNVKLDCGVPARCRVPILYETHGAPAAVNAPIICANPANEYYANATGRDAAVSFVRQIRSVSITAQGVVENRPAPRVILYGSPETQWSRWDNPREVGFARGVIPAHTQLAFDAGCDFGPSMYFMDTSTGWWKDKHNANISVIDRALEVWNIEGRGTPPRVYPFVSVFYAGRHEDGERSPVPVEQTRWLLDALLAQGWTPVVWAHAYTDQAMREIRGQLYQLREYMR